MSKANVVDFKPWEVYQFPWGTAVKKRGCKWSIVFIGEQQLDVDGLNVELYNGGIKFINGGV